MKVVLGAKRCMVRGPCAARRKYHPLRRGGLIALFWLAGAILGAVCSGRSLLFGMVSPQGGVGVIRSGMPLVTTVPVPTRSPVEPPKPLSEDTSKQLFTRTARSDKRTTDVNTDQTVTSQSTWTDPRPLAAVWNSVRQYFNMARPQASASSSKALPRVSLYVMVKSAPKNKDRRNMCRTTWQLRSASDEVTIKGLVAQFFLIGKAVSNGGPDLALDNAVAEEARVQRDILSYPGNDTYKRLPWKVLWGFLKALNTYHFDFMLLCDDDSFVNYAQTFRWIGSQTAELVYAGHLVSMTPAVQRDPKNPWAVSRSLWSSDYYPPYHWGAGYFLTRDLVNASLFEAGHHTILWIDDVFIGVLLNATGLPIKLLDIPVYAQPDWKIFLCCEASPIVLGSRTIKKMRALGIKQSSIQPLCRSRRSKFCMRTSSF